MKKTLEQCKEIVAKDNGYENWYLLTRVFQGLIIIVYADLANKMYYEQMYSECDMRLAWEDGRKFEYDHNGGEGGEFIGAESFDEWIKQFKKK